MPRFPKPYADVVARLRVPVGFLALAAFAWLSAPSLLSIEAGIPICVVGLALRAWAAGHLAKNQRLAASGPYAYARNPLYSGSLLTTAGMLIASRSITLALLFAAIFVLVYLPVIELEEQHLRSLFPEYADYADKVPRFWPRLPAHVPLQRFQFGLYIRNREYQALIAWLAGLVFLVWKGASKV